MSMKAITDKSHFPNANHQMKINKTNIKFKRENKKKHEMLRKKNKEELCDAMDFWCVCLWFFGPFVLFSTQLKYIRYVHQPTNYLVNLSAFVLVSILSVLRIVLRQAFRMMRTVQSFLCSPQLSFLLVVHHILVF